MPAAPISGDAWAQHSRDDFISRHVHGARVAVTEDQGPAWAGLRRLSPAAAAMAVRSLIEAG